MFLVTYQRWFNLPVRPWHQWYCVQLFATFCHSIVMDSASDVWGRLTLTFADISQQISYFYSDFILLLVYYIFRGVRQFWSDATIWNEPATIALLSTTKISFTEFCLVGIPL